MKNVQDLRAPLAALAPRLGIPPEPGWFGYLVRKIGIREVRLEGLELVYASFIPVEQLLREKVDELNASGARLVPCRGCGEVHDAEHDEGIFEDPAALEGFLCRRCAEGMSAWTYYSERLKL